MSEGFNWLIQDLTGWKEKTIDAIIMCFRQLQIYYEQEISRGYSGIGNYTLKTKIPIPLEQLSVKQ
jgi:hypothetical protein